MLVLTVKNTSPAYGLDVRKFRLDQPLENVQPRSSCILSMAGSGLVSKDESDVQFQDLYRPPSLGHSCVILFYSSLGEFHVFSCFLPFQGLVPPNIFKLVDHVPDCCVSYQCLTENSEDVQTVRVDFLKSWFD